MNDFTRWVSAVEAVTGKKRGRHPVFNANQFYPHGVELELRKLTRDEFSRFLSECADAATIGFEDDLNEVSGVPEADPEDVDSKLGAAADKVKAAASADFVKWSEMLWASPTSRRKRGAKSSRRGNRTSKSSASRQRPTSRRTSRSRCRRPRTRAGTRSGSARR